MKTKIRRIVEFGLANYSQSYLTEYPGCQDMLLAAEPLLSEYSNRGQPFHPPNGMLFCHVDEIAIADYDGEVDIKYMPDDLHHADTTNHFDIESWAAKTDAKIETKSVKCLTLDSWLNQYSEQGFTTEIDNLSISFNGNAADAIFQSYSFNPRPALIVIRQPPVALKAIECMQLNNYDIHICNGNVIGVRC